MGMRRECDYWWTFHIKCYFIESTNFRWSGTNLTTSGTNLGGFGTNSFDYGTNLGDSGTNQSWRRLYFLIRLRIAPSEMPSNSAHFVRFQSVWSNTLNKISSSERSLSIKIKNRRFFHRFLIDIVTELHSAIKISPS